MILFLHKFTINVMIEIDNSFYMALFLALHPMEYIFLSSSDLLEHLAMLQTSTLATNFLTQKLLNYINKAIGIINFTKLFLNFLIDTMI